MSCLMLNRYSDIIVFPTTSVVLESTFVSNEKVIIIQEDDDKTVIDDFLLASKDSIAKIWMSPEEDEAWKDL